MVKTAEQYLSLTQKVKDMKLIRYRKDRGHWQTNFRVNGRKIQKKIPLLNKSDKKQAREFNQIINKKGFKSGIYNTDLKDDERQENLESFKAGKLKVGLDQDSDLRRLELMEKALSKNCDNPILYVDSNEYWSPKQTIRKISEMEERFSLGWIEEPARRWDFLGLKKVSDSIKTPVCAGENLDTLGDFLPYFHHRSADVIQVSHGMTGITGAMQIADAAYALELPVTLGGSYGIIHAHIANAIPNCITIEVPHPEPETKVFSFSLQHQQFYYHVVHVILVVKFPRYCLK